MFAGIGALGALAAGAFRVGATAQDADDRIVCDGTTGSLFFDADGSRAGTAVLLARIGNGLPLTAGDFFID